MGRLRALLAVLAGCYAPQVATGVPCSPVDNACPGDQMCIAGICGGPAAADAPAGDAPVDAANPPDDTAAPRWSDPTLVPGVSTDAVDDDPSMTADGLTIVFASERNGPSHLFMGTRPDTASAFVVVALARLDSAQGEHSPEISADGKTLYFTSERNGVGDGDIFMAKRSAVGDFGDPVRVEALSLTGADEGDLAISPDGLTAIISRNNAFFRSTRPAVIATWSAPVAITGVDFGTNPAAPSLDAAGDLYFHAGATRDLFVAKASGDSFLAPAPIAELNTAGRDAAPFISADEKHLVFERDLKIYESTHP